MKKADHWLANRVYSGVPSDLVGLDQKIRIGPMSGKSNVLYWLERQGVPITDALADEILDRAKSSRKLLTDDELFEIVQKSATAEVVFLGSHDQDVVVVE